MSAKASKESKLSSLHIDMPSAGKQATTKTADVIDSWEDDDPDENSNTQTPIEGSGPSLKPVKSSDPALGPPPPTPISPGGVYIDWSAAQVLGGGRPSTRPFSPSTPPSQSDSDRDRRRPEKTTAAASRMIAAGLGMKTQKTDEQKQYDRAVREQEMKRRAREKEDKEREKEVDDKIKAAVWDG